MKEHIHVYFSVLFFIYLVVWFTYISLNTIPRPRITGNVRLLKDIAWKTGDIILYHTNPFIHLFTNSIWSHVGIVVIGKSGLPRILEITAHSHYVSLNKLHEELKNELSNGNNVIAFRRITPAPDETKLKKFAIKVVKDKVHYDHVYWREFHKRIFGNLFPIKTTNKDATEVTSTVCSGLIASALQDIGILEKQKNHLEYLPTDFGDDEKQMLNFNRPYKMGPLIFVKMEK